MKGNRTT